MNENNENIISCSKRCYIKSSDEYISVSGNEKR